jgi:hypothetical protein
MDENLHKFLPVTRVGSSDPCIDQAIPQGLFHGVIAIRLTASNDFSTEFSYLPNNASMCSFSTSRHRNFF